MTPNSLGQFEPVEVKMEPKIPASATDALNLKIAIKALEEIADGKIFSETKLAWARSIAREALLAMGR